MVKKILLGTLVFIILIASLIGFWIYSNIGPNSDLTISNSFAKKMGNEIFKEWNHSALVNNSTPDSKVTFDNEETKALFINLQSKMGSLKSISDPITEVKSRMSTEEDSVKYAVSYMKTEYENGKGTVYLVLLKQNDEWKIQKASFKN